MGIAISDNFEWDITQSWLFTSFVSYRLKIIYHSRGRCWLAILAKPPPLRYLRTCAKVDNTDATTSLERLQRSGLCNAISFPSVSPAFEFPFRCAIPTRWREIVTCFYHRGGLSKAESGFITDHVDALIFARSEPYRQVNRPRPESIIGILQILFGDDLTAMILQSVYNGFF